MSKSRPILAIIILRCIALILVSTPHILAQNTEPYIENDTSEIFGRVLDDKKEPMISASVLVFQDEVEIAGTVTDYDGKYWIKHLKPGKQTIVIRYIGYDSTKIDVYTSHFEKKIVNVQMRRQRGPLKEVSMKIPCSVAFSRSRERARVETLEMIYNLGPVFYFLCGNMFEQTDSRGRHRH